ncbi:MAG: hypothetical protein MJ218_03720 [Opitutales bacterium]|nr:hypothetical protein [Opitutales bacterium]
MPKKANRLIASLRQIPYYPEPGDNRAMVPLSAACQSLINKQQKNPDDNTLDQLKSHWAQWFRGTDFEHLQPARIDSNHTLWLYAPNAILRQKAQLKCENALKIIRIHYPSLTAIQCTFSLVKTNQSS